MTADFIPLGVYFAVRVRVPALRRAEFLTPHGWVRLNFDLNTLSKVFDMASQGVIRNEQVMAVPGDEQVLAVPSMRRVGLADASDNYHDLLVADYWALFVRMSPAAMLTPSFRHKETHWFSSSRLPVKLLQKVMETAAGLPASGIVRWPQALQMGSLLFVDPHPRRLLERVIAQRPDVNAVSQVAFAL